MKMSLHDVPHVVEKARNKRAAASELLLVADAPPTSPADAATESKRSRGISLVADVRS